MKYTETYKDSDTLFICLHHFGGTISNPHWSSQHQTIHDIDMIHKARWPSFRSELGFWVGYNFIITADGEITQTRKIGEETAAVLGRNQDGKVISIALAGNFTKGVDIPTQLQISALKFLLGQLPDRKLVGHRYFSATDCPGNSITDAWMQGLRSAPQSVTYSVVDKPIAKTQISIMFEILARMLEVLKKMRFGKKQECEIKVKD